MGILTVAMNLEKAECVDKEIIHHGMPIITKLGYQLQRLKAQGFFIHGKIVLKDGGEISTKIRGFKIGSTQYRNPKDLSIFASPGQGSSIYIIISDQNNKEREIHLKDINRIEEYSLRSEGVERLIEQALARLRLLEEEEESSIEVN